ncbi:MAG: type IV-A pilus assembly ATPase PilB [Gammaproteobacteria bacterium]|nr:type IV-A pilus assembly ATPase PilB [Gammaproteobacteria bacterium]
MAVTSNRVPLGGLARKLVADGLLEEPVALCAFQDALSNRVPFVKYLIENKLADSRAVAQAASQEFGVPLLDIEALEIDPDIVKLVSEELIHRHHALPVFKRGNRVYIAVSDPTNLQALDEIKFHIGANTDPVLVEENKLARAIEKSLAAADSGLGDMEQSDFENLDDLEVGQQEATPDTSEVDDAPVVRFVNKVLLDAIKRGASDLHFEPYEKFYRVRFRVDGMLAEMAKPPLALAFKIAARIKVMSRLDVSERRVPQDGRIKLKLSKTKAIDFRVSTCPTLYGEKVVMRILDSDVAKLNIDQLGYEDFQKALFLKNLEKPYGMFLVTGPTGSGKTVSLYTGINIINRDEINISTAEDPVEINLAGVNQVQVDERTGMTFSKALKAFLRQDPDIILVGEIRDMETASIAVKAAQTGHMVMSTLHTNDGPQTITRLQDMGIPPFAVATTINLITAQRLARRLHPDFRVPQDLPPDALLAEGFTQQDISEGVKLYGPGNGGADCPSGYKGRVGIYQVMPITDAMKRMIMEGSNAVKLADQSASEGIWDIRKSGLQKARQGMTSLAEINRVTVE